MKCVRHILSYFTIFTLFISIVIKMQGHRILITLLTAPIIASSASFLSISQPITGPASTSLSSHSSESNDSPVNTLDLDFEDPIHESGDEDSYGRRDYDVSDEDDVDKHDDGDEEDDDDDDDNDLEDDDAWEEEFDLNPNNATDRETSLNITFHPSAAARRVLPVKRIKCSRHRVGHNIPGAIKALTDWGHEHLVGRNNVSRSEIGVPSLQVFQRGTKDPEGGGLI